MVEPGLLRLVGGGALVLTGLVVGALTVALAGDSVARSTRIAETETTPAADIESGTVELKGTARATADGDGVPAPTASGEALVAQVGVYEYGGSGTGSRWPRMVDWTRLAPFVVADDTGTVYVDPPAEATVRLAATGVERVDPDETAPEPIRRFVEASGLDSETDRDLVSDEEKRRYTWKLLTPDEDAYVLGETDRDRADWDHDAVVDGGDAPGEFVVSNKSEETLLRNGLIARVAVLTVGGFVSLGLVMVGLGLALV